MHNTSNIVYISSNPIEGTNGVKHIYKHKGKNHYKYTAQHGYEAIFHIEELCKSRSEGLPQCRHDVQGETVEGGIRNTHGDADECGGDDAKKQAAANRFKASGDLDDAAEFFLNRWAEE